MRKYYTIYGTKENKYFYVHYFSKKTMWAGSELVAQWFASRFAAKIAIKNNGFLKNNPNLCIKEITKFK